ncbi:MAG TPA: hypothetical protein VFS10_21440 [Pyrinomonadaceae bacterium]|nr:hypothetical protein [Pyrinomonadaceae bacterium]
MNQFPAQPNTSGDARFVTHHIIDEYHQGMIAATFEHPPGWRAQSQLVWNFQDTAHALQVYALAFDPNGVEACAFMPVESCFWLQPSFFYTPGQKHRGQTYLPPMSAPDALTQFAIPKYRGDRWNLRIVFLQPVPNMAQMLGINWLMGVRNEGVMARLEYEENGQQFEEDFYACVMWHPPIGEQTNWALAKLFSLRAARGQLDASRQELWRVATSWQTNPQWVQLAEQVQQQLHAGVMTQFAINDAVRRAQNKMGQQLREYREWESGLHQQMVNDRWASQERINERRGEALGGYQRFEDPNSAFGVHYDKSLSKYSWTNGYRWIHQNNPLYDPNTDPNESRNGPWTLANPL